MKILIILSYLMFTEQPPCARHCGFGKHSHIQNKLSSVNLRPLAFGTSPTRELQVYISMYMHWLVNIQHNQ